MNFGTRSELGFLDTLVGEIGLLLAQRDANCMDPVIAGSMQDQAAPPTADIQQALARPQPKFAADVIQLLLLRSIEGILSRVEICAGIHHAAVQPKLVKLVRNVVVKADSLPVA